MPMGIIAKFQDSENSFENTHTEIPWQEEILTRLDWHAFIRISSETWIWLSSNRELKLQHYSDVKLQKNFSTIWISVLKLQQISADRTNYQILIKPQELLNFNVGVTSTWMMLKVVPLPHWCNLPNAVASCRY